jgi:hypothetical protein
MGMTTDGARMVLEAGNSGSFFMSWPSTLAGGEGVVPRVEVDKTGLVEWDPLRRRRRCFLMTMKIHHPP